MKFSGGGRRAPLKSESERVISFVDFARQKRLNQEENQSSNIGSAFYSGYGAGQPEQEGEDAFQMQENEGGLSSMFAGRDNIGEENLKQDMQSAAKIASGDMKEAAKYAIKKWKAYKNLPPDVKKFIGIRSAMQGPVGKCPHCNQNSIYASGRMGDGVHKALTSMIGFRTVTYYCMNRDCDFAWNKGGQCYRKRTFSPLDERVFKKDVLTSEKKRIFRIEN